MVFRSVSVLSPSRYIVTYQSRRVNSTRLLDGVDQNTSRFGTAFTVSIDAVGHGVTTGISAYDRATTIRMLCDEHAKASDFAKPGHTFPLRAAEGGVLTRAGQRVSRLGPVHGQHQHPALLPDLDIRHGPKIADSSERPPPSDGSLSSSLG